MLIRLVGWFIFSFYSSHIPRINMVLFSNVAAFAYLKAFWSYLSSLNWFRLKPNNVYVYFLFLIFLCPSIAHSKTSIKQWTLATNQTKQLACYCPHSGTFCTKLLKMLQLMPHKHIIYDTLLICFSSLAPQANFFITSVLFAHVTSWYKVPTRLLGAGSSDVHCWSRNQYLLVTTNACLFKRTMMVE